MGLKRCGKCKEEKPGEGFSKRGDGNGLRANCKTCRVIEGGAWREANKERHAATMKAWYEANKERARVTGRAWREANKERHAALSKAWREANKERHAATIKAWEEAN